MSGSCSSAGADAPPLDGDAAPSDAGDAADGEFDLTTDAGDVALPSDAADSEDAATPNDAGDWADGGSDAASDAAPD